MYTKIFAVCIALLATTVIYTSLLYETDKTDRKVVSERIKSAIGDGELLANLFPPSSAVWTRDNLSGIDQSVESFYALMVLYQDKDHPWMNALNPGYYQAVDSEIPQTEQAKLCAFASKKGLDDLAVWDVAYKPRFWHGVKAVLLSAFKYLELSQIHWMIKISTFFAFALIALQVMYIDRKVGLAYTAFTLSAFYCSSILFFGGGRLFCPSFEHSPVGGSMAGLQDATLLSQQNDGNIYYNARRHNLFIFLSAWWL
jgi:hypothetical protein